MSTDTDDQIANSQTVAQTDTLHGGTCAAVARPVVQALHDSFCQRPATYHHTRPSLKRIRGLLGRYMVRHEITWESVQKEPRHLTEAMGTFQQASDRCLLVELAGTARVAATQYVDDMVAPCASYGAALDVIGRQPASACSRYALKAKASFHYAPAKTAIIPLRACPAPEAGEEESLVASSKVMLGVLVDSMLTFEPLLRTTIAKAWSLFRSLLAAVQSAGFSVPMLLHQVEERVIPVIMYPAVFLALADCSLQQLDRMQVGFARACLGASQRAPIRHSLLLLQCGWTKRLSTKVIEEALMALARLRTTPQPTSALVRLAEENGSNTCLQRLRDLLAVGSMQPPLLEIHEHPSFAAQIVTACSDTQERKTLLRHYRTQVIRPRMAQIDEEHFLASVCERYQGIDVRYQEVVPLSAAWPVGCRLEMSADMPWQVFRCWSLLRCSGRWPMEVYGKQGMPACLDACPMCSATVCSVMHPLASCPGTQRHRDFLYSCIDCGLHSCDRAFFISLFQEPADPDARRHHMWFVYFCFKEVADHVMAVAS